MAATIDIDLPTNVFTNLTSTLSDDIIFTIQNRGSDNIELIERASTPVDADIGKGVYLSPKQIIQIKPVLGFDIFGRPVNSVSRVVVGESV